MSEDHHENRVSRRRALRLLAAAQAAAVVGAAAAAEQAAQAGGAAPVKPPAPPKASRLAKFIAGQEEGLTSAQRKQLLKQVPGLEGALKKLRDLDLPDDVEPALSFRALRSARPRRT